MSGGTKIFLAVLLVPVSLSMSASLSISARSIVTLEMVYASPKSSN